MEFVSPKECNKIINPVFNEDFDFEVEWTLFRTVSF